MAQNPMNPFDNDMNDIFNQLMGGMNGFNSDNRRYLSMVVKLHQKNLLNIVELVNCQAVQILNKVGNLALNLTQVRTVSYTS